jgi:hypothetical protein
MKQKLFMKLGEVILSLLLTANMSAQTTLASWDFTKLYTKSSTSGTSAYYTPSNEAFSGISATTFATETPFFYPITYTGDQTKYTISGGGNQWRTYNVFGGADCFQILDNPQNDISDITNASTHKTYFEIAFDATGYKDITVNAGLQYDNNGAVPMEWVISSDGGSTWADGGTTNSTGNWWTVANSGDKEFAVSNQSDVRIRIVGKGNNTSKYWGINSFTIKGTAITSETFYTCTATPDDAGHGGTVISPIGGSYESGTSVTVTATHKTGYKFKEWQIGGSAVSTDNPYTFSISANTALTAVFEPNTTYTLNSSYTPAYTGIVTRSAYQDEYDEDASITLTATPNTGYAFVEWQDGLGNQISIENPYTFNINANTTAVAIFKKSPVAADTDITVASWTFNTGYDIDGLVYTPNTGAFAEIAQTQAKNNQVKQFNANNAYGALTDYVATVSNDNTGKTYYSIKNNHVDQVFSLYPSGISNSVTDYTNASEHTVYYEFSFPTIGLKDVKIAPAFTYGNNAVKTLEVVYSTDGGTTWVDGGSASGTNSWYQYGNDVIALSAANKNEVIVRLLPANGEDGDYRMNSFTVTGTVAPRSVTITSAGYATYYNDYAVEIPSGLKAYWGKLSDDGKKIEMTEISDGIIPAETGVVVKGDADTYALTATAEDGSTYASNVLRGVVANTTVSSLGLGAGNIYVLAKNASDKAVFAKFTGSTLGDHRAYLFVPDGGAPELSISFGDETTGISDVAGKTTVEDSVYYNLNGQRISQPTKGLYIVNGKKIIK